MRTTVDIDDDVLCAARALAAQHGCSLGSAISQLARQSLNRSSRPARPAALPLRGRFALLPDRREVVTVQRVRRLMEIGGA